MSLSRASVNRTIACFVAVVLGASLAMGSAMSASAQVDQLTSRMSAETLASVDVEDDGSSRLVLMRFTLEPSTTIQAHSHSGPAVFTVISGELQTELIRGGATVTRDGAMQAAEVGGMIYLSDGESIAYAPNAGVTIANDSNEPLLLMASIVLKHNEPVFDYDYWPPPVRPNLQ